MTEFCFVPPSNNDDSLPQTTPTVRPRRGRRGFHNIARHFHESYGSTKFQLSEPKTCPYCQAKLFHRETSNMCCANGKIVLPTIPAPAELQDLFCDQTAEGRHFRQHIRSYNHVFAFTSMGVHVDQRYATGRQGVYTFRAQGAIYHQIGGLLPNVDCRPRYLQLYVYDTDHEIDNRMSENDALNRDLIEKLKRILDNNNPFVNVFRQLGQREDVSHCKLVIKEQPSNRNQYHLPTTSQVAAVIVGGEELANLNGRDIIVETISGHLRNIQDIVGYYDPLQYPLLLPYGTYGWDVNTRTNNGANVSCRDFYAYILQIRPNNPSLLLRGGRLLQQYVVDNWVKIETHKLRWIRSHQDVIRAELYQGLHDSLHAGENDAGNVGRRTILPSSFYGSPRDMYQRYQDAMALVQRFGRPDLFLTMTCNPNWDDIRNELLPGQLPQDRPDLLSRIFRARFEEFKVDVIQKGVFGKVIAHAYVIEYQKRGLPHSHMILILDDADKLRTPDDYDRIVRAEIPAQQEEPALYEGVLKHMIHGPCGVTNPLCPCMKDGKCKKSYPKPFSAYTKQGSDSYPTYRRRDTGIYVPVNSSGTVFVDNGWVVPYNPWVLIKYDCHINVEICASVKCIKYLYKYVYKGPDRVALEVRPGPNYDEVQSFIDARWVSAPEALWRMFMFQMNHLYPSVVRLQIHLPNRQQIRFYEDETISNVLSNDQRSKTMLTEFFTLNRLNSNARRFLYRDIPEHFRWVDNQKIWVERTGHNKVIGRIYTVSPSEGERFYLRILLNHVKGPRSFTDMATVHGVVHSTFRKAAEELGLLHEDGYLRHCLQEAADVRMPLVLRRLFVSILVFCEPNGVRQLWDEFHTHMLEDYSSSSTPSNMVLINKLLLELKNQLHQHNKDICDFDLPSVTEEFNDNVGLPTLIRDELAVAIPHDDLTSIAKLNCDQSLAFDAIIGAVERRQNSVFFVDGPGGTGKTYLYRAILANLRKNGHIAIATATSGIAATLLPGGRTAHSRFKIPLNPDASSVCSISRQSDLAELIKRAALIMWDEATMTHRYAFEALDRTLQDIMHTDLPFGGKVIVLGGDFRQVLPVVPKGTKMQQIHASVVKSMIWNNVQVLRLGLNMRALDDRRFSDFLLRVGNGDEPTVRADLIKLPSSMVIPWEGSNSINHLINFVFPNIIDHSRDPTYMVGRALITPTNEDVDKLNDAIINMFPGNDMVYKSWDSVEDDINHLYQEEFLNSVCPSGLAPHKLTLREGCPIMLLRNIDPKRGLCNGTRLFCRKLYRNFIDAEILTGHFVGTRVFLHRIPMKSAENSGLPFELTRRQFPIKLSFALTINKAQGQTIPRVGIFLPDHVFSHGQLYVALSRGISESTTRVLVKRAEPGQHDNVVTRNVVYREVLLAASDI